MVEQNKNEAPRKKQLVVHTEDSEDEDDNFGVASDSLAS